MVFKAEDGKSSFFICCDCGLRRSDRNVGMRPSHVGQLLNLGLVALFGLTAVGVMAIRDHQTSSLLEPDSLELNQTVDASQQQDRRRRWVVIPGTPGSAMR